MSTYLTSRADMTLASIEATPSPTPELMAAAAAALGRARTRLVSSRALAAVMTRGSTGRNGTVRAHTATAALEARWAALGKLGGARAVLRTAAPGDTVRAEQLTTSARAAVRAGEVAAAERTARDAEAALQRALAIGARRLGVEERQVLAAAGERALRRLGFAVRRSEGRRTTALWAETETRVIAVACRNGGVMYLDVAGCQGNGCDEPVAALNQAFAGEGIHLEMRRRTDHGDDRGGTLIRRSSASPEGIVAAIEEEAPVSCNRLQPAAVSRPRVGLGGGRR